MNKPDSEPIQLKKDRSLLECPLEYLADELLLQHAMLLGRALDRDQQITR